MRARDSHSEKKRPATYDVAVLGKALDILETLAEARELGLSALADRSGVSKAASFRVLSTLETRGYVAKDPHTRKYRPGPSLIVLSSSLVSGLDLLRSARPVLERLHALFGETVNLGVLSEAQVLYMDMLESPRGLRTAAHVGTRDPLHSTALGKALLAAIPANDARRLLSGYRRERHTDRTLVSLDALERELTRIRRRGFALDDEENERGARCVGAAVLDNGGQPIAAVSISGPSWRIGDSLVESMGERLVEAARAIEMRMGYATRAAARG
jgi:IclR family transcriptional regulator, acetate operon repressor